ncbi:MAG: type-F conjugative transfer system pilin assembly protein TrbC [Legionellales bacterium]|nr:type-F conjugative transfer system pilin assembly protein TrbC [Legionellales bacterium]
MLFIFSLVSCMTVLASPSQIDNDKIGQLAQQAEQLQSGANKIKRNRNDALVFISLSMPTVALKQWVAQAREIGAPVILRGFVHNSLKDTERMITHKLGHNFTGFVINPKAYEKYQIKAVPALVVTSQSNPDAFDVVYGNANLYALLKVIADNGQAGKATAQSLLNMYQAQGGKDV